MATMIHPGAGKRLSLTGRPLIFQRGQRSPSLKKSRKRLTLRLKHVLALFVILVGFFFALGRVYLFLVSWDRLAIRTYELFGGRDDVRMTVNRILRSGSLGNILVFDPRLLQNKLKACPWIKDARVQKIFPSSLRIEIAERVPFALFEKQGLALVAEDGTVLEPSVRADSWPLPVVRDEGSFLVRPREKWESARACLKDLSNEERAGLASLECSDDGRITLEFRDDPLRLILDGTAVRERLDFFAAHREEWEGLFGLLEYVDLRFEGRAIVRPLEPPAEDPSAKSQKEAE